MEFLPVTNERVTLRRLAQRDLDAFQTYRLDPSVGRFQGWSPMTADEARRFLNEMNATDALVPGQWFQLGIAMRISDALVGDIGICLSSDAAEAEIGFTLRPASQGQGLAAEAVRCAVAWLFAQTGIQRVVAITDERNDSAKRLLSAVGMKLLRSRPAVFRDERCVECTYVVSRPTGS